MVKIRMNLQLFADGPTLEQLQEEVIKLREENKTLAEGVEGFKKEIETRDSRITELQEHNQKLFLKITSPEEKPEEEEKGITIDEVCEQILQQK